MRVLAVLSSTIALIACAGPNVISPVGGGEPARFVEPLVRELFEVDIARSKEWTEVEPVGWRDYIGKIIAEQL